MKQLEVLVLNQLLELDSDLKSKKYLLAVSGGSDSTCLIAVFHQLNLDFEIAHCNFQLRGEESNGDEEFVRSFTESLDVKGNYILFNTKELAKANKTSIQEEARSLRYNWFKELARDHSFDYIVTAHHQEDVIETFFINTVRGTGIKGLRSIPLKIENIIRPLLSIPKELINEYLVKNNISYRSDSSNNSLKYSRNYLRHKIIPNLENVHQNAKKGIVKTIENLIEAENYLNLKIQDDCTVHIQVIENGIKIKLTEAVSKFFLLTVVSEKGFNNSQLTDVLNSKQRGGQFFSSTHIMYKEDAYLVVVTKKEKKEELYTLSHLGSYNNPLPLQISIEDSKKIDFAANIAYFDAAKIQFPFILRKWKAGDVFFPFGMKGKKKLSDYFIDLKLSRFEKEHVWVLENNHKICWVVGKRIDNRFKITEKTTKIVKIVT